MAAPTLQAQGSIAAVTTGSLTVTLPAHATSDILVVTIVAWNPDTVAAVDAIPSLAGWTIQQDSAITVAGTDGRMGWVWRRAASGSETNPTFTKGANWVETNNVYAGRAYVIRGCATSGNPWDDFQVATFGTGANPSFSALTVSGAERMAIHFYMSDDNNTIGTVTSWTAGTGLVSTTGSDSGFQTYRQDNVSSNTSTGTMSGGGAPGQGQCGFMGVSFKPPSAASLLLPNQNKRIVRARTLGG